MGDSSAGTEVRIAVGASEMSLRFRGYVLESGQTPSVKSFGRWKRTKVPEERSCGPLAELWGFEF